MAIFTPRGLKIRLDIKHAFALMARLYPAVDSFKILKTTEGFELIPQMFVFIVGLISFYLRLAPYQIVLFTIVAGTVGAAMRTTPFGTFVIPGLSKLATLYSYISGFGIYLIFVTIYGFFAVGWQGVAAFYIGKFISAFINITVIELWILKRTNLTTSEIDFFNAYRLHASERGRSIDIAVSEEEIKEGHWKDCLEDLALKWPEVVRRFTKN